MTPIDPVELAERIINLLDSAKYSTTYKWATLDAIVQVVTENVQPNGQVPPSIRGRAVGSKVLEIYWRQSVPFTATTGGQHVYLKQSANDLDIPGKIARFRQEHHLTNRNDSISLAQAAFPREFAALEKYVQETVIRMPLPKLQKFGNGANAIEERFIYDYGWRDEVPSGQIQQSDFNDEMILKPGVALGLIKIQNLLRPYIENLWIQWVANKNREITDAAELHGLLFGVDRQSLIQIRPHLVSLQKGQCFYCDSNLHQNTEVDHFLPFSKHSDDTLDNLVAACRTCNGSKSDSYASLAHLGKWRQRFFEDTSTYVELDRISRETSHMRKARATESKAAAVFLNRPQGMQLWHSADLRIELDHGAAMAIFCRT